MQQRQLRLGDILDDYCPRERRVTNHAVVAMIGDDVKQTRCTTCDTEHQYKHARVPRQRRKSETPPALYAQVAASAPKRVAHEHESNGQQAGDATASHEESMAHESTASSEPVRIWLTSRSLGLNWPGANVNSRTSSMLPWNGSPPSDRAASDTCGVATLGL